MKYHYNKNLLISLFCILKNIPLQITDKDEVQNLVTLQTKIDKSCYKTIDMTLKNIIAGVNKDD